MTEEIFSNYATALRKNNKLDEALFWYNKCLSLSPLDANTHACIAFTLHLQQKYDDAISSYHRALGLQPAFTFCIDMLNKAMSDSCTYMSLNSNFNLDFNFNSGSSSSSVSSSGFGTGVDSRSGSRSKNNNINDDDIVGSDGILFSKKNSKKSNNLFGVNNFEDDSTNNESTYTGCNLSLMLGEETDTISFLCT